MKFIKSSVLLSVMLFAVVVCNAQSKKPKKTIEQKGEEITNKLNNEVKLNNAQFKQIKTINIGYVRNKRVLDKQIKVLLKAKKELKKERRIKINAILTAEQREKKQQLKKKHKKKK